ncbi:invasion associated locus B family protein [Roseospirillum parvum]|uniref:Invasion protein IalB, involved in pathogenesis n=1 Tax=Roseospirillum parvum TaxID=83401 RepID=A0A1G7TNB6_9PROT|nr:invasion associated locus B family protein [Roseospirillum parvum]SDG36602.1 hypothetical protein SAMN05421742_10148 [Roseospirillum parvum]
MAFKPSVVAAIFGVLLGALAATPASATEVERIGVFGSWSAYTYQEQGNKVCYMASRPLSSQGDYTKRGDVFMLVSHRPGDGAFDVVNMVAGYPYADGVDVEVEVGDGTFSLYTEGDRAWTRTETDDRRLTQAIAYGKTLRVRGLSSRGTETLDTFSLRGSLDAYKAISKACNHPVK